MIDAVSCNDCVLCKNCANVCPVNAISFDKAHFDFFYPHIDTESCIGCNKCETVCPVLKTNRNGSNVLVSVIARNKDSRIRKSSTSGGVFMEAAEKILKENGIVCGAIMDKNNAVKHICSDAITTVQKMSGSKYVQSDIGSCFSEIETFLKYDRKVLFTGCPCQAGALKSYLGREYPNLIIMELICHGIPSQDMFNSYIQLLESKYHSKVTDFRFRDKTLGWHRSTVSVRFDSGSIYRKPITIDSYMRGFLGNTYLKDSCYHCRFRNFQSGADLILGDFWGAETEMPQIDDNTGLSAVIICSEKGKTFFEALNLECFPISSEKIIKNNRNIVQSPSPNQNRGTFYRLANEIGYSQAIEKMFWESKGEELKRNLKYALRCVYYKLTGRGKPLY